MAGSDSLSARSGPARFARMAVVLGLLAAAVAVWEWRAAYRGWEATVAGSLSGFATASHHLVDRHTSTYFVNVGTPHVFGMRVTPECTSAVIIAAFLVIMAATATATAGRVGLRRTLAAGLAAMSLVVTANLYRLVVITFATNEWGLGGGFHWSHVWLGSFVTVFALAAAVALYLRLLAGPGRAR